MNIQYVLLTYVLMLYKRDPEETILPHLCLHVLTHLREHHTSGVTKTGVLMLPYVDTYSIVHAIWMKEEYIELQSKGVLMLFLRRAR